MYTFSGRRLKVLMNLCIFIGDGFASSPLFVVGEKETPTVHTTSILETETVTWQISQRVKLQNLRSGQNPFSGFQSLQK